MGTTALNVVIDGTMPSGAGDPPELLEFAYSIGRINAIMTSVGWQPVGRVRFRCSETDGADYDSAWTAYGLSQSAVPVTGLTVGEEYTLYYQIDPEPDYAGWDEEAWRVMVAGQDENLPTWTQPSKNDPLIGEWEPDT